MPYMVCGTAQTAFLARAGELAEIDQMCRETPNNVQGALRLVGLFESLYLSMHVVTASGCSCVAFNSLSVCWHVAFRSLKLSQQNPNNLGVRLRSFPIPLEAARLYMGVNPPRGTSFARAAVQDTPRRKRITSKQSDAAVNVHEALSGSAPAEPVAAPACSEVYLAYRSAAKVNFLIPAT